MFVEKMKEVDIACERRECGDFKLCFYTRLIGKLKESVIAGQEGAKQSHKKRLRLPRRYAPRNDNFFL